MRLIERRRKRSIIMVDCFLYYIDRRIYLNLFPMNSKRCRAESYEACCQWALLTVQIISLLFRFTVHKYIHPPVSKVYAGSFRVSVIHRTLTRTTHSYACICARWLGTPKTSQHNILTRKKLSQFCSRAPDGVRTSVIT